ncbi:MAG: hypothetical protein HQ507_07875 [Candidatus Marinimicrobia bacterium]|nr:hypothetical protein [Candidatus Neomarinimicrobiota bacterium]
MTTSKCIRLTIASFSLILFSIVICSCGPTPKATPEPVVDPLRFSGKVADYKAADSLKKPIPNSLLFVGSSSIDGWKTLAQDFPEVNILNRGLGGSHMSDLIYFLDDIVFPYRPNAIVVYEGDNDIASGKSPEKVLTDFNTFTTRIFEKWPNIPIFFISIKPSLARIEHMGNMAKANALIKARIDQQATVFYIDVYNPMLGADGTPLKDIFGPDGLHMNEAGYALWIKEIKKELGLE